MIANVILLKNDILVLRFEARGERHREKRARRIFGETRSHNKLWETSWERSQRYFFQALL
jgi:hypothetical protein